MDFGSSDLAAGVFPAEPYRTADSVLSNNACQLLSSELGKQDGFCLYTDYLTVRDGNLSAVYPP